MMTETKRRCHECRDPVLQEELDWYKTQSIGYPYTMFCMSCYAIYNEVRYQTFKANQRPDPSTWYI